VPMLSISEDLEAILDPHEALFVIWLDHLLTFRKNAGKQDRCGSQFGNGANSAATCWKISHRLHGQFRCENL
jgi:hypothetical protein